MHGLCTKVCKARNCRKELLRAGNTDHEIYKIASVYIILYTTKNIFLTIIFLNNALAS